jgi:hypothetical protein
MTNSSENLTKPLLNEQELPVEQYPNQSRQVGHKKNYTSTDKSSSLITIEQYHQETSAFQRTHLQREVAATITDEILDGRVVELYRLGILSLTRKTIHSNLEHSGRTLMLKEEVLVAGFEKCCEITADHRQVWPELTGISELSRLVHYRLQPFTGWSERETRRFIKGFFLTISKELIELGQADALSEIGILHCLPERHIGLLADRISHADIFLESARLGTFHQELIGWDAIKTVSDAWEPLRNVCGTCHWTGSFNLLPELVQMGYSKKVLLQEVPAQQLEVPIAVFELVEDGKTSILVCSNGLRYLGSTSTNEERIGTEIVLSIPVSEFANNESFSDGSILEYAWIRRAIALTWVLLQSSKNKTLGKGAAICNEAPLDPTQTRLKSRPSISAILINDFDRIPNLRRCSSTMFNYKCILGITQSEFSENSLMPTRLQAMLERKGLAQEFRRSRPQLPSFAGQGYVV